MKQYKIAKICHINANEAITFALLHISEMGNLCSIERAREVLPEYEKRFGKGLVIVKREITPWMLCEDEED